MKISKELPQFPKRSILVSVGGWSAEIFEAYNGEIQKIDEFKHETIANHANKDSFFIRSGRGSTYGFGAVLEEKRDKLLTKFVKELAERTEKAFQEWSAERIYLFVPGYLKEMIKKSLSSEANKAIVLMIEGNFVKSHPFSLLEMVADKIEKKKPVTMSSEAKKLLKKD